MAHFTGYLLGKVQLDGAIRSEVLASLVETLIQRYQPADPARKLVKFNENHRYSIECSERGLKLTSTGVKSKDEGFESDSESIRSVKISDSAGDLDIADLIDQLDIGKEGEGKETESSHIGSTSVPQLHSSLSSSGGSMDNTSLSSSSGLHVSSDDSNSSSSGNGSDSDEFCNSGEGGGGSSSSPFWEMLPNLSCFQSYPIEDVVFCHCDSQHTSTLVWVVRHLTKMMALVTAFRTRSEAEDLFQTYRDLRVRLKPLRYGKFNGGQHQQQGSFFPTKLSFGMMSHSSSASSTPSPFSELGMGMGGDSGAGAFCSLPPVYPTEILHETQNKSPLFSSVHDTASLDFEFNGSTYGGSASTSNENASGSGSSNTSHSTKEPLARTGSNSLSLHQHIYVSNPNIIRHEEGLLSDDEEDVDDDDGGSTIRNDSDDFHHHHHHHHIPQPNPKPFYQHQHHASTSTLTGGHGHLQLQLHLGPQEPVEDNSNSCPTEAFKPIPPEKPQRKMYSVSSRSSGGTISSISNKLRCPPPPSPRWCLNRYCQHRSPFSHPPPRLLAPQQFAAAAIIAPAAISQFCSSP